MRRLAFAVVLAAAWVTPASAADIGVGIPAKYFFPQQLEVVPGDTVTWTNSDHDTHNLVADDGSFTSGLLFSGARFSQTFDTLGSHHYICTLHPYMTGEVDVVPIALARPEAIPTSGQRFTLTGRAPAGSGVLTVERSPRPGAPFVSAGSVAPGPDGSFSVPLVADESSDWRVSDGAAVSAPVPVPVVPRVELRLGAKRVGRLLVLSARSLPARPGETVRLELYSKERFDWLTSERAKLDSNGEITFSVRRGLRRMARIAYEKDGAIAYSRAIRLWRIR